MNQLKHIIFLVSLTLVLPINSEPSRHYKWDFPADHGAHHEFNTEWWYFTGHLTSATKENYGFELTFFRVATSAKKLDANEWIPSQVYLAHFALTDDSTQKFDFFDRLKSVSRGYASLDYSLDRYELSDVIKLDILLNGDKVDALAYMAHRTVATSKGQRFTEALKEVIPRQQFDVAIQAAIGGKIISRQTVKAYRKDVTAKLYGGDVTRKMKLQKKQKAGKKRMKNIGKVEVPQDAFLSVLRVKD